MPLHCLIFRTILINTTHQITDEYFNDWGGGDTTIPSPWRSPKQSLPGIGLHDPVHSRQACPEFNSFHQGVGEISPRKGIFLCRPLPKRGQICDIPAPPPIVERLRRVHAHLTLACGRTYFTSYITRSTR